MIELSPQSPSSQTANLTPQERVRLRKARHKRIRQVKAILRYLPRRASLHRYPVIKWFHKSARKRAYLWSFKTEFVSNALFWGCILAFLPIVGIQIPLATILAMFVRANLPVIVALQWISNPGTLVPIYFASYKIGDTLFRLIGVHPPSERGDAAITEDIEQASSSISNLIAFVQDSRLEKLLYLGGATTLGGLMVGLFLGTILATLYRAGFRFGIKKIPRVSLTIPPMKQRRDKKAEEPES